MTAKLTKELAAALHATGDHELEVIDPDTSRVYFMPLGVTTINGRSTKIPEYGQADGILS